MRFGRTHYPLFSHEITQLEVFTFFGCPCGFLFVMVDCLLHDSSLCTSVWGVISDGFAPLRSVLILFFGGNLVPLYFACGFSMANVWDWLFELLVQLL